MEIGQTTATQSAAATASPSAKQNISSDFETFLRMLTVQLQNQDPLNPVESSDYAVQLATFSGVEQAVRTNDLLVQLTEQMTLGGMAEMAAWVGKEARAAAPAYFDGEPITLSPNPAAVANRAQVVVRNAEGIEVQRFDIPLVAEPVQWAGVTTNGTPFQEGLYSFEIINSVDGQELSRAPVEVYSTVTEVRSQDGQSVLILEGGAAVTSGQVTALRDPSLQ